MQAVMGLVHLLLVLSCHVVTWVLLPMHTFYRVGSRGQRGQGTYLRPHSQQELEKCPLSLPFAIYNYAMKGGDTDLTFPAWDPYSCKRL